MAKAGFVVGDVVKYEDTLYVVIGIRDYHENSCAGSSFYDYGVDYKLCKYEEVDKFNGDVITESDMEGHVITVNVSDDDDSKCLDKVEDIAPYEILSIDAYSVRKKTPKTIVVYV